MENSNIDNTTQEQEDFDEGMGLVSRIVGVFFYPVVTFQQIGKRPDWLAPLLITVVLGTAVGVVASQKIDVKELINRKLEQSGKAEKLSQAQKEQMERFTAVFVKASPICAPAGIIAIYLISALIYFGILKLLSGQATFKQTFSVICYSSLISIISNGIAIAMLLMKEPGTFEPSGSPVQANLTIFLNQDETPKLLYNAAKFVDFFLIWQLILVTIGLAIVNKISTKKTGVCVFLLWLIFSFLFAGLATLGQMVQNVQQGGT